MSLYVSVLLTNAAIVVQKKALQFVTFRTFLVMNYSAFPILPHYRR